MKNIMKELLTQLKIAKELLNQLKTHLKWLSTHNNNYTKQQYDKIIECLKLIEEMED